MKLDREASHKLTRVLRHRVGDPLELLDPGGGLFSAVIRSVGSASVTLEVQDPIESPHRCEGDVPKIILYQAIPKGPKFDLIAQKVTEIGVAHLIPVLSERSFGHDLNGAKWESKAKRLSKIIKEATLQSERAQVMAIDSPISIRDIPNHFADICPAGLKLHFDEDADPIKNHISRMIPVRASLSGSAFGIVIGPEGGFASNERAFLRASGFTSVSMGAQVLRVETAALVAIALLHYEWNRPPNLV